MPKIREVPLINVDSNGDELVTIGFKCPLELYDNLNEDSKTNGISKTKNLIKILKKYYGVK